MLYTLNLHINIWQLFLTKTGKKLVIYQRWMNIPMQDRVVFTYSFFLKHIYGIITMCQTQLYTLERQGWIHGQQNQQHPPLLFVEPMAGRRGEDKKIKRKKLCLQSNKQWCADTQTPWKNQKNLRSIVCSTCVFPTTNHG